MNNTIYIGNIQREVLGKFMNQHFKETLLVLHIKHGVAR